MYYAKVNDNTVQLGHDLRMSKPMIDTSPGAKFYGYQENSSLMDGRWEGFVSVIQSPAEYAKRLVHFGEMMAEAKKQTSTETIAMEITIMKKDPDPRDIERAQREIDRLQDLAKFATRNGQNPYAQASKKEAQRIQEKIAPTYKWAIKDHDKGDIHELKTWELQDQAMATLQYTIAQITNGMI